MEESRVCEIKIALAACKLISVLKFSLLNSKTNSTKAYFKHFRILTFPTILFIFKIRALTY